MLSTRLLSFALLLTALPAQTEAQAPAGKPHIVIETVGPDGWNMRLGPTNVGGLLSSEEGKALWQPQVMPILGMWHMLVGDDEAFVAARERIFGYGGSVRLAVRFTNSRALARPVFALELRGDGRTTLADMSKDLRQLLDRGVPGEWEKARVGEHVVDLRNLGPMAISAPVTVDDHLLVVATPTRLLGECGQLVSYLASHAPTIDKPSDPALRVTFDMPSLLKNSNLLDDKDTAAVVKALGFQSLDELSVSVGTAGPRVAVDVNMTFSSDERGMFAAFMPASTGLSAMTRLIPEKTTGWKIGRFDSLALGKAILAALDTEEFFDDGARAEFKEEMGFDLLDDLLTHMNDEIFVMGSPLQQFDRPSESTWALAFGLRDQAKFEPGFQKLLAQVKPFLNPAETVDVDGIKLRRYGNLIGYDLWIGVGRGMLLMSGGRDGEEEATALLERAMRPIGNELPQFADLQRHLPAGAHGVAFLDADSLAGIPSEWWFEILEELVPFGVMPPPDDMDDYEEQQEQMRALLKKHKLHTIRSATGYADRRWSWRIFW